RRGAMLAERGEQCVLLRDIVGNPFRSVRIDPAHLEWNDRTVPRLAAAIYRDRAFDRLPVLADALEEAGCAVRSILDHCRGPGPHVRGCWVVDLAIPIGPPRPAPSDGRRDSPVSRPVVGTG